MKRILLVDDSLENLKMLKSSLEESCEVTPVTSALLAQNYLNDGKADMILFDASRQLTEMTLSTVITVANIVDAKDKYAGGHSLRVAMCAKSIAKNLGWTDEECQNLYNAVLLHDIGMISVSDTILNKPGRLENEEYEEDETEYTEEAEEDDFEDDFIAPVKPRKKKKKGAVGFLRNLGVFEFAVAAVAIVIVALLVVIGVKFISNKQNENKQANSQFATLGLIMENMDGIGNDGINAIGQKAYIESISKKDTDRQEPG